MKFKPASLIVILFILSIILVDGYFNTGETHATGAPAGYCGSVVNSLTCTYCHSGGSNAFQAGWITSNVPASGYVPGTTYNIGVTAIYPGRSKFGFEISPQNSAGTYLGLCLDTSSQTQLIVGTSGRKYMTHTSAGTTGTSGSHTWAFNWTAPAVGSGTVTIYGAFLCANGSGTSSGDLTYKSNLVLTEDLTTGIDNHPASENDFKIYPNPASDHISVFYKVSHSGPVEITLYDNLGKKVLLLMSELRAPGDYENSFNFPFNLNSGIYFLEISSEINKSVKRILVQQ